MPRISDLSSLTTPSNDDELAIVDKASAITKKIKRGDLIKGTPLPADSVDTAAIQDGSVTSNKIDWTTFSTIEEKLVTSTTTSSVSTVILSVPHAQLIVGAKYKITASVLVNKGSTATDSDMYLRANNTTLAETIVSGSNWGNNYLQATVVYTGSGIQLQGNSNGKTISNAGTNLIVERVG